MAKIHFLNVGNGDCTIIEHNSKRISMIDICNGNTNDTSLCNPISYLRKLQKLDFKKRGKLFRFILTHPDMDHLDGIKNLNKNFSITNFWDTQHSKTMEEVSKESQYTQDDWDYYNKIHNEKNTDVRRMILYRGSKDKFYLEDNIQIISPTKKLISELNKSTNPNWNDASYVLLFKSHERKILFCGDSGNTSWKHIIGDKETRENIQEKSYTERTDEEKEILDNIAMLEDIDILFAPHHGRKSGGDTLNEYLDFLNPKLAVLGSAPSEHKNYDAFHKRNIPIITNDEAGNIIFNITPSKIRITCDDDRTLKDIFNSKSKPITRPEYVNAWSNTFKHFGQEVKFDKDENGNPKAFYI